MVTSSATSPRSEVVIAGRSRLHMPVSQISATSAFSSSALACRNGLRLALPDSSSPSSSMVTLSGRLPVTSFQARAASTKVISWPLSSQAPRAAITLRSPASVTSRGSNGGVSHRSIGSTGWTS